MEEELRLRSGRLFRLRRTTLGAARNYGAAKARGDFLLFMDDDNVANANEVRLPPRGRRRSDSAARRSGVRRLSLVRRDSGRRRVSEMFVVRRLTGSFFGSRNLRGLCATFLGRRGGQNPESSGEFSGNFLE